MDCTSCRLPITDPSLSVLQGNTYYHSNCLRCVDCDEILSEACYRSPLGLHCSKDFIPRSVKCSGCSRFMSPTEPAIKLTPSIFYHPSCLKCFICETPLTDKMGIHTTGDPLCPLHLLRPEDKEEEDFESPPSSDSEDNNRGGEDDKRGKRRGPRTTIKAHQLEKLQEIFLKNPKPNRSIRESLAKKTGLPIRVIQVWFQNKRSKEKRLTSMRMYPTYGQFPYYSESLLPSPPGEYTSNEYIGPPLHHPMNTITPPPSSDEWI